MALPLIDIFGDLLSASGGALVGAVVTSLLNRGRNRNLSDQIVAGQRELKKQQVENQRLLAVIQDKENTILKMQMDILQDDNDDRLKRRRRK